MYTNVCAPMCVYLVCLDVYLYTDAYKNKCKNPLILLAFPLL